MKHHSKATVVIEGDMIKKIFKSEEEFYTEYHFYKEYSEFPYIPKFISADNYTIYLEYIKGKNLYDCNITEQLFLAKTLALFHNYSFDEENKTAILHYDTNLRNYICINNEVFMIDFSNISIDYPLCDVYSALLFFAELYAPDVFKGFCDEFYNTYFSFLKIKLPHSRDKLENEIKRFEERRERENKIIYNYHWFLKNISCLSLFT